MVSTGKFLVVTVLADLPPSFGLIFPFPFVIAIFLCYGIRTHDDHLNVYNLLSCCSNFLLISRSNSCGVFTCKFTVFRIEYDHLWDGLRSFLFYWKKIDHLNRLMFFYILLSSRSSITVCFFNPRNFMNLVMDALFSGCSCIQSWILK